MVLNTHLKQLLKIIAAALLPTLISTNVIADNATFTDQGGSLKVSQRPLVVSQPAPQMPNPGHHLAPGAPVPPSVTVQPGGVVTQGVVLPVVTKPTGAPPPTIVQGAAPVTIPPTQVGAQIPPQASPVTMPVATPTLPPVNTVSPAVLTLPTTPAPGISNNSTNAQNPNASPNNATQNANE